MKQETGHGDSNLPEEEEVTVTEGKEKKSWLKKAGKIVGSVALNVGLPAAVGFVTAKAAVGDLNIPFFGKKSTAAEETTRNEEVAQQPRGEFRNNNSNNGGYRNNNNYQPRG